MCIRSVVLLAFVFACPSAAIHGGETGGPLAEKVAAVTRLWEYQPDEFRAATRLTPEERATLTRRLSTQTDSPDSESVSLLLAINCQQMPTAKGKYAALERYRCRGGSYESLAHYALSNPYILAFTKAQDVQRSQGFLSRLLDFLNREAKLGPEGLAPEVSERELISEVINFLGSGGYDRGAAPR